MAQDKSSISELAQNLSSQISQAHEDSRDALRVASDPALTEDLALALLKRAELSPEVFEQLARNSTVLKSRKVKLALVGHAHTPRHISIPLVRRFYTFDLMRVALSPTVPADVKVIAEDVLISRLQTVTLGERLTLARRSSGRIAAALLLDTEPRIMKVALENGRLTEALVIRAVLRLEAGAALVEAVLQHGKWSLRRELRIALLRSEFLPPEQAIEFSREMPSALLREILANSRLPESTKDDILRGIDTDPNQ